MPITENTLLNCGIQAGPPSGPPVIARYPGQAHMAVHATYNREAGRFESSGPDHKGVHKQVKTCGLCTDISWRELI